MSRAGAAIFGLAGVSAVAFLSSIGYLLATIGEARALMAAGVVGIMIDGLLAAGIAIEARRP